MSSNARRLLAVAVAVASFWAWHHAQSQTAGDSGQGSHPVPDAKSVKRLPPLPRGRFPKINVSVGYKFVESWPQKPPGATWDQMAGIAIDPSGNIWTLNRGDIPVQAYRPDGALVTMWGQGMFVYPHQLRFDKAGNLWAVDSTAQTIMKFTTDGKLLQTLGV